MPNNIFHKRSLTPGSIPTTSSLNVGEIAMNVPDGKIFLKKSGSAGQSIETVLVSNTTTNIGLLTLSGSLILSGSGTGSVLDVSAGSVDFDFDTLSFSGSASITGSLVVTGGITGSLLGTSSYATQATNAYTASYVLNAQTASYVQNAVTASYVLNSVSSSYALSASYALSSSYALSASYASTASYSQNLIISGSINNVDYIDFNTGSATPAWKPGRVYWDNTDGALAVYNAEADITLQVGQESWVRVFNQTGLLITDGTPVRLIGAQGDVPKIVLAQSAQVSGSALGDNQIIGVATHDIETNSIGYVTTQGLVRGLNTNAFTDGDLLFVSSSAGVLTNVIPQAPYEVIQVGICVKAGPGGSGIIFVFPTQPIDFGDLASAERGTYQYGDIWSYQQTGSVGVWKHGRSLSGSYSITGSLNVMGGITGSLLGTASYATTASYALTSSYSTNISGTTNYISKFTGTNSLGNSVMFESGSRIGIGTTTPERPLQVYGSLRVNRLTQTSQYIDIETGETNEGRIRFVSADNNQKGSIIANLIPAGGSAPNSNNFIDFQTGTLTSPGSRLRIDYLGNVGIGTIAPTAKLHIAAQGALSTDIVFRVRNSADTANILTVNGAGDVWSNGRGYQTSNTMYGEFAGGSNTTGNYNSFFGSETGAGNIIGNQNSYFGWYASRFVEGYYNVALGVKAGTYLADGVTTKTGGSNNIYIGQNSQAAAVGSSNEIVIGQGATGLGSNTVVLGNDAIATTALKGKVGIGTTSPTHKLHVSGSTRITGETNTSISSSLTVYGSGSAQPVFTVQGSQGELFSITDSLSGSLFSVNDISGLPILEVFSDNTTLIGNYQDPMLITTAKVVQTNSGSFTMYSLPTASYDTAFFEYSVRSGSNARAGTIMAIQSGSAVNFTETTTTDFGSTSAVSFTVVGAGSNMALTGSSTSRAWTIKTIIRGI